MKTKQKIATFVVACILIATIVAPMVNAKTTISTASITGKPPVVQSITFTGDTVVDIEVSLLPYPDTTEVEVTAVIYCKNGPKVIDEVTLEITPLIEGYADIIEMEEESTDPSANTADYTTTINIPSNTAPDDYMMTVTATHRKAGVAQGIDSEYLTVLATMAIETNTDTINFGTIDPGNDSVPQLVLVSNIGNVNITLELEPTDLSYEDDVIPANSVTTTWDSSSIITVDTMDVDVDVKLSAPEGIVDGTYSGEIVFAVALSEG